jgi:hypothetical protein
VASTADRKNRLLGDLRNAEDRLWCSRKCSCGQFLLVNAKHRSDKLITDKRLKNGEDKLRYNLILAYHKNMNMADFMQIGHEVRIHAPDIEVFVVPRSGVPNYVVPERPTLIFSPRRVQPNKFPPGKIYCGRPIPKLDQMRTFSHFGLPVPKWAIIRPDDRFTSEQWGRVVVVKPSALRGSYSRGITASRPEDVRYLPPESFPEGHPGRDGPMLVQQFIDTGLKPAQIRVLTLFGEPLYAEEIGAADPQPMPEVLTPESIQRWVITPVRVNRKRSFVYDKGVLRLASRAYGAFPDIPVQGCDVLREAATGKLFLLEINAGSNTWHFSSHWGQHQKIEGRRREEQFDAFKNAARVLIERTRNEASFDIHGRDQIRLHAARATKAKRS